MTHAVGSVLILAASGTIRVLRVVKVGDTGFARGLLIRRARRAYRRVAMAKVFARRDAR